MSDQIPRRVPANVDESILDGRRHHIVDQQSLAEAGPGALMSYSMYGQEDQGIMVGTTGYDTMCPGCGSGPYRLNANQYILKEGPAGIYCSTPIWLFCCDSTWRLEGGVWIEVLESAATAS